MAPTFLLELKQSEDQREVYVTATARMVAKSLAPEINATFIRELLNRGGFALYKVKETDVDELVTVLNETLEQIQAEEDTEDLSFDTNCIAEAVDAEATVTVPSDKLSAVVTVTPAMGGKSITFEDVEALLEEEKVSYGLDNDKLKALLLESEETESEQVSAKVAFALMPIDGRDAEFIPLVPTANERILKPQLREDGTVDMHDLGDLPTVRAGRVLMRKEPPTKGEQGINVFWEFIPPKSGKDHAFKPGTGTGINPENDAELIALISGQPNLLPSGMKVDDAVQVKAVDLHTGNMVLDANLLVKGNIGEGMKVRCEGDITVGGVIESADVKAKGNIIIGKGIIGRPHYDKKDTEFSSNVVAEGDIFAMFASYSKLKTTGDLHVAEQLLHCDVTSEGKVTVGNEKTVGSQIVGGVTRAQSGIETDILGASAGVKTQLDMSGLLSLKQHEISCNHSIIADKEGMLNNMRDAASKFMTLPSTPARQEHIEKIKNTINFLHSEVVEAQERNEKLKQEEDELRHSIQIIVNKKMQPNVSLKLGSAVFNTTRARESGRLYYEKGEIKYLSANMAGSVDK